MNLERATLIMAVIGITVSLAALVVATVIGANPSILVWLWITWLVMTPGAIAVFFATHHTNP